VAYQLFMTVTCGAEPEEMRKGYQKLQKRVSIPDLTDSTQGNQGKQEVMREEAKEEIETVPLTPLGPDVGSDDTLVNEEEKEEYDSDEGMIIGAYYVKDDGSIHPVDDNEDLSEDE